MILYNHNSFVEMKNLRWSCAFNTDKTVLSELTGQSKSVHTEAALLLLLTAGRMGGESSCQYGYHKSIKLQSTELGLWLGADSFLTATVCLCGWQAWP